MNNRMTALEYLNTHCPCGMKLDSTSTIPSYLQTIYHNNEIVYAICMHGHVVIDKLNKGENNENRNKEEADIQST